MGRFFPNATVVTKARGALAADSDVAWEAAFRAARTEPPYAPDLDEVIAEFVALASEIALQTDRAPFWVAVVPFTEDGVSVGYRAFAVYPGSTKIVHAGQHARAGEPLADKDRAANPYLAAFLVPALNSVLMTCRLGVES